MDTPNLGRYEASCGVKLVLVIQVIKWSGRYILQILKNSI